MILDKKRSASIRPLIKELISIMEEFAWTCVTLTFTSVNFKGTSRSHFVSQRATNKQGR